MFGGSTAATTSRGCSTRETREIGYSRWRSTPSSPWSRRSTTTKSDGWTCAERNATRVIQRRQRPPLGRTAAQPGNAAGSGSRSGCRGPCMAPVRVTARRGAAPLRPQVHPRVRGHIGGLEADCPLDGEQLADLGRPVGLRYPRSHRREDSDGARHLLPHRARAKAGTRSSPATASGRAGRHVAGVGTLAAGPALAVGGQDYQAAPG